MNNLSVIIASIAVIISFLSLIFQRIDIRKSRKYQRKTFELQNIIDEENTIIELASKISSNVINQADNMIELYDKEKFRKERWKERIKAIYMPNSPTQMFDVLHEKAEFAVRNLNEENKRLISELKALKYSLKIHIITKDFDSEVAETIIEIDKYLQEISSLYDKSEESDENASERNIDSSKENYRMKLDEEVIKFQNIFTNMKIKTEQQVEKLQKNQ